MDQSIDQLLTTSRTGQKQDAISYVFVIAPDIHSTALLLGIIVRIGTGVLGAVRLLDSCRMGEAAPDMADVSALQSLDQRRLSTLDCVPHAQLTIICEV